MPTAKEATMRRIAIVLASLPQPVAQRLLGSLQNDSQQLVRAALGSLVDVDPLERRRALDGFASSLRNDHGKRSHQFSAHKTDAAEVVFSRTAMRNLDEREPERSLPGHDFHDSREQRYDDQKPARFAFLKDVDDESLVAHLSGEMPQTLAIILASISPAQAARVLPRLDFNVRAEAMRRMANLKEFPTELVDDIGNQLRTRLTPSPRDAAATGNGAGQRALDAILAELPSEPPPSPKPWIAKPQDVDLRRHGDARTIEAPAVAEQSSRANVRIAQDTWPDHQDSHAPPDAKDNPDDNAGRLHSSLQSTDAIHQFLISLPPDRLRDALGKVAVRQALLAICGLPNATAEAVLASLPRKQAKQVREQLTMLGRLELREIDEAKQTLAAAALSDNTLQYLMAAAA